MYLDVNVSDDLEWRGKKNRILLKSYRILKRTFNSRDPELWKDLYVSLLRSNLKYAVQALNPHLQEDFETIERVATRITI